ncbi:MAG: MFS transporter [Chloroflexi bacterium]|nr:MFS transporter [Chloroflexota bacterium]
MIAVFCLGWAAIYADRTALYPMLPIVAADFGLSSAQAGALTSFYFIVYTIMQVPPGIIGDRVGLKRVLLVTYTLAGLGMLAVGLFAQSYLLLAACIALHGLGAGAYYTTAYATTMLTVPAPVRGFSSAIINAGMALGLALGLAMAGPIYLATQNWRTPFLLLAAPTLALVAVFGLVLRDTRPRVRVKTRILEILGDRQLLALDAAGFCSLYGFFVIITWAPTFLQSERGLSLAVAGAYTAVVALASLPSGMILSRFSDRIGRKRLSLALFPMAALAICLVASARSGEMLVLALLFYGLVGKLAWDPIAIAWVGDLAARGMADAIGSAIGVFSFCAISAAVVGPVLSGWIRDTTGSLEGALYLGAAVVGCGFLFALVPEETVARPAWERR